VNVSFCKPAEGVPLSSNNVLLNFTNTGTDDLVAGPMAGLSVWLCATENSRNANTTIRNSFVGFFIS
jgi:hypothetical protein